MDFDRHLFRWGLVPDGDPISTHSSDLLPVLRNGDAAMLKVARAQDERSGAVLMEWWKGQGAALVLERDGDALLTERAVDEVSLAAMARNGRDDEASRVLCAVTARLHARRGAPPPPLVPLTRWFEPLWPAARRHPGLPARAAEIAKELLADQREAVALHGDIHHRNVLDFGPRGWLAIDPKGLMGERTFDFVNILRNPDASVALAPGRLARQAGLIAETARLDRTRLLRWTVAFAGLSAAWIPDAGGTPDLDIAVAEIALADLGRP